MVHNVTLYEARDAIGDTWISTIWRCHRVLLRCLCCGVGNPEKNVVICSIVLDEEPPTEQVRSLSRSLSLSFSLSLQLHTVAAQLATFSLSAADHGLHLWNNQAGACGSNAHSSSPSGRRPCEDGRWTRLRYLRRLARVREKKQKTERKKERKKERNELHSCA